jgi:hypothetical protein
MIGPGAYVQATVPDQQCRSLAATDLGFTNDVHDVVSGIFSGRAEIGVLDQVEFASLKNGTAGGYCSGVDRLHSWSRFSDP